MGREDERGHGQDTGNEQRVRRECIEWRFAIRDRKSLVRVSDEGKEDVRCMAEKGECGAFGDC